MHCTPDSRCMLTTHTLPDVLQAKADPNTRTVHFQAKMSKGMLKIPLIGGKTPLHTAAASHGTADIVRTLLRANADLGAIDDLGRTPLDLALIYGDESSAMLFAPSPEAVPNGSSGFWERTAVGARHKENQTRERALDKSRESNLTAHPTTELVIGDALKGCALWRRVHERYTARVKHEMGDVYRQKLGLLRWHDRAERLCYELLELMEKAEADHTVVWRQLASIVTEDAGSVDDAVLLRHLYEAVGSHSIAEQRLLNGEWGRWVRQWLDLVASEGQPATKVAQAIQAVSPKYVPRQWMLEEASAAAETGDFSVAERLQNLFAAPYAEQEGMQDEFYARIGGAKRMS